MTKEKYQPTQEENKKAESLMSNAQKKYSELLEKHYKEMEAIGKSGLMHKETRQLREYGEEDFILRGEVNGNIIEINVYNNVTGQNCKVNNKDGSFIDSPDIIYSGKINDQEISEETVKKIIEKFRNIAIDDNDLKKLKERHEKEQDMEEIIDDILK